MNKKFIRRMISVMLMVVMLFSLIPSEGVQRVKAADGNDVARIAESQIGYKEGADNYNKYGAYFGHNNTAWCAYFVAWCMKTAGVGNNVYNYKSGQLGSATPNDNVNSGVYHVRGSYIPKRGDLIYIDWGNPNPSNWPEHVEVVTGVSNGRVYSVGGNKGEGIGYVGRTSPCLSLGDSQIKGYCEIDYSGRSSAPRVVWSSGNSISGSTPTNQNNPDIHPVPTRILRNGNSGNDVRWVQSILNRLGYANLSVDGVFGSATRNAVRSFQQRNGLSVDGIVGYYTRTKMQELWNATKVVNPTSISLSVGSVEVTAGYTKQLSANVQPGNATNKAVVWSSSDSSIATISGGKITGIKAGTTTISASTHNGKRASCKVTVYNPCVVSFVNDDGTLISEQQVQYGGSANAPKAPSKVGHTFSGWNGQYQGVRNNQEVKATYTKNKYKVDFKETNGKKIIETQTVLYDEAATAPEEKDLTIPDGYQFNGWSETFDHVDGDMTIYPVYKWADDELPMVVSADKDACKADYDDGIYSVSFTVKNHSDKTRNVKIMTYMSTKDGKLVAQGETRTVRVPAAKNGEDGSKLVEDMIITCKAAADKAKVVVLDDYESAVPLAEIKDIDVEAAGYGKWTDKAPDAGESDYMQREVYRSKQVNYTTSANTSVAGWTQYAKSVDHYNYGGWVYAGNGMNVRSNDTTRSDAINYNPNPFSYPYPDNIIVRQGQQGAQGCYIQACLIHLGYSVAFDGIYGANTAAAVKNFQANNGLAVDGLVGPATKAKLTERFNALPKYNYYTRSKSPVYKYSFYKVDDNWSDWTADKINGDTSLKAGTTKFLVETGKQYRYKEFEADNSGTRLTPTYELPEEAMNLAGKNAVAIVFKNKVSQISEDNVEYVGDTKIGEDGKINLSFIPREELSYADTGDYTVAIGVKGTTNYIKVGTIEAEKPEHTVTFTIPGSDWTETQVVKEGDSAVPPTDISLPDGYEFKGWDTDITSIKSDITVQAKCEYATYNVTYVDWEHKSIEQKKCKYNDILTTPEIVEKEIDGKEFKKWNMKGEYEKADDGTILVKGDLLCEAQYGIPEYTVTFVDNEGKVVDTQIVNSGGAAMEPDVSSEVTETIVANPDKKTDGVVPETVDNMKFVSWGDSIDLSNITANITVGAIYQFDETVQLPEASVKTGEYDKQQTVTLSTDTDKAVIYYTTDGSDPKDTDNKEVKIYKEPITITEKTTLKFYATRMGMNDSDIVEEWYAINTTGNVPTHVVNIVGINRFDGSPVNGYKGYIKDGNKLNVSELLTDEYETVELDKIYYDDELTDEWQQNSETITDSLTLYAVYDARKFNVVYTDEDGTKIAEKKVRYGESAQDKSIAPAKDGYKFTVWESDDNVDYVTKDMIVKARYVEEKEYATIQFTRASYSIMVDTNYTIHPKVKRESTKETATDEMIQWSSSDKSVATVDDNGVVNALQKGEVTITAKLISSGEKASCKVKITGNPETSICLLSNSTYKLENSILRNISPDKNTVADISKQIDAQKLKFYDSKNVPLSLDDRVGTGTRVQMSNEDDEIIDEVTVLITGDYTGDGEITNKDVSGILRILLGKETANDIQLLAIDVNGDGYVNNRDAAMLARYLVGKEEL